MRSLLRSGVTFQVIRQGIFKLQAIHTASPRTMRLITIALQAFQLCLREANHAALCAPYAIATCCCQSSSRSWLQSRCARNPLRRAVQRSYDNPEVARQPLSANAVDRSSLPGANRRRLAPSGLCPLLRPRWSRRSAPMGGSSCVVASEQRLPPYDATRSKKPILPETCQSYETTAGKLPASDPPPQRCSQSCANTTNRRGAYAGRRETRRLLHLLAWPVRWPLAR